MNPGLPVTAVLDMDASFGCEPKLLGKFCLTDDVDSIIQRLDTGRPHRRDKWREERP
jgi:hypothetical protein